MAYEMSECARDNFDKFIHQFQPETKTLLRKHEKILIKSYRQNVSSLFNQTYLNKRLLPNNNNNNNTHTRTYIYIYIYMYIYNEKFYESCYLWVYIIFWYIQEFYGLVKQRLVIPRMVRSYIYIYIYIYAYHICLLYIYIYMG